MENLQERREYQAAMALENYLSDCSWNPERFAESVRFLHRTNQQTLFRTIIATIRYMAADSYGIDQRNQASHEIAKRIIESGALDEAYIPFI